MDANLEKIENSEAYIEIEVDSETFEEGLEHSYRKIVKQVNLPGFRKGRAPRQLLEAHFGREILYEEALEYVVPIAYEEAIEKLDIKPIVQPEFEIGEIEPEQPIKIKVKVAVKPEVKLGAVEGLEVTVPSIEVTEQDIDNRLEEMRSRYAEIVEKTDEPAAMDDTLVIDFEGSIDEVPFEGGTGEDYSLELGSKTFIPGFEEQLEGVRVGETKNVEVTFPESYHANDLAGKDAVFKVTVKNIKAKKLRPLDDAFAQEVSEFETIGELREDVAKNLKEVAESRKKEMAREEVITKAIEGCEITVADSVIEAHIYAMLKQFEDRIASQGVSLEQYLSMINSSVEDFKQDMWPEAERTVKTNFMLEKLVEEKGFEVTDEELNSKLEEAAKSMNVDFEQAKKRFAGIKDSLIFNLKVEKAIKYLVDNANIKENNESDSAKTDEENN